MFLRFVGISALIAVLFVAACNTNKPVVFGVVTTSAQLPAGQINVAYTQTTLTAANGTVPYTFAVTGGALPAGMTLSSAGVLSGTPTASGSFNFTVTATDSDKPTARTATASLAIKVNAPPAITSGTSTTFTVGSAGTFTVTATGFPAPTFSETGTLPSGVTLNSSSGVLSGTPAAGTGGTYPITITAQNGATPNATQSFTLTVDQAPAITSANSAGFVVSTAGTFTVTASGFPAPTLGESGPLPTGVTFNAATGVLSGTPAVATQGSYPITFTAQNGVGANATQNFTLTVGLAPAVTSASSTTFTVGSAGTFTVTATGFPVPTYSETGALPSGVSLNPTSGVLSGTPGAGTGGSYSITITAQNGIAPNATQNFTLKVNQASAITSANTTSFTVASFGSFAVTATGFPAPTFSETGPLPSGVTLNSASGLLSGTPAGGTQGSYSITITAQNGVGTNATQNFTLNVELSPAITSAANATFTVGSAGTFTVAATGFPAPTFGESGALPTGLSFNTTTGVLSGTPAANTGGTYSLQFTAQNGVNPNATQIFSLTVHQAPAITSAGSTTFAVGSSNSFTVTASGFPAPTLSQTGTLPSGVTFNTATGVLSGTPASGTQAGSPYPITFTAQNGVGANANQSFTLNVAFTAPPSITSANNATFTVGSAGTFTVTATGAPAPTFGETGTLPSGVTLNPTTGVLSGTPAAGTGGNYSITITAQNGISPNASQPFTLTVDQAPAITSANSFAFTIGQPGSFTVTTTGFPVAAINDGGATLPSGLNFVDNGNGTATLNGNPAVGDTVGNSTITLTASNSVAPDAVQSFTLTINAAAPIVISPSSSSLPNGTQGTAYSQTITASGGISPYTFSLDGTSAALPAVLTFTNSASPNQGVISGTPTAVGTTTNIIVDVTDSDVPPVTKQMTYSLTINPAISCPLPALGNEALLSGTYAGLFDAFADANGPAQAAAVFVAGMAGGKGVITNGEVDFGMVLNYNNGTGVYQAPVAAQHQTISSTGSCFQLGSDNRGYMVWNFGGGNTGTFAFSLRSDGAFGRFIEFDDATPSTTQTNTRGAGVFQKQSGTVAIPNGPFAFGLTGYTNDNCPGSSPTCGTTGDLGYQRLAVVGQVTSDGTGGVNAGEFDVAQASGTGAQGNLDAIAINTKTAVSPNLPSTFGAPDSLGRGIFTINGNDTRISGNPSNGAFTVHMAYYFIDASHFFLQGIDAPSNAPLFNGEAIVQTGTFGATSLGGSTFFSMTGGDLSGNAFTALAAGRIAATSSGTITNAYMDKVTNTTTDNVGTAAISGGSYTIGSNGIGSFTLGNGQAFSVAMFGVDSGFVLEGTGASPGTNIMTGLLQPQTVPSSSSFTGLFIEGSANPSTTYSKLEVGSVNLTSPSTASTGSSDSSQGLGCGGTCLQIKPNNISITGYSIDANGRITVTASNGSGGTQTLNGWAASTSHAVLFNPGNGGTDLLIQLDH